MFSWLDLAFSPCGKFFLSFNGHSKLAEYSAESTLASNIYIDYNGSKLHWDERHRSQTYWPPW